MVATKEPWEFALDFLDRVLALAQSIKSSDLIKAVMADGVYVRDGGIIAEAVMAEMTEATQPFGSTQLNNHMFPGRWDLRRAQFGSPMSSVERHQSAEMLTELHLVLQGTYGDALSSTYTELLDKAYQKSAES